MGESRLQFTDAERSDPEIGKKVRRAEKAAVKADKAQTKIPTHKKPELVADNSNGKIKDRLNFEETRKKPPSELQITKAPTKLVRGQSPGIASQSGGSESHQQPHFQTAAEAADQAAVHGLQSRTFRGKLHHQRSGEGSIHSRI